MAVFESSDEGWTLLGCKWFQLLWQRQQIVPNLQYIHTSIYIYIYMHMTKSALSSSPHLGDVRQGREAEGGQVIGEGPGALQWRHHSSLPDLSTECGREREREGVGGIFSRK